MPWLDGVDPLRRPFEREAFVAHADGLPVHGVVYVQVDATPAYGLLEARWAVAQAPLVDGVVAWAPVEDGESLRTYLDELVKCGPTIKGVRRLLQSEPDPDFLIEPTFMLGLRLLPAYGFTFDVCIVHQQLARTVEMVRACPETQFVLDHLGKPGIRSHLLDPWRDQLAALAELPNCVCKISGLVTEADHRHWSVADLKAYVAHALAVFGEDRVMFGGDWPVVTLASTYRRWVETLESLTEHLSDVQKRKLWADNARRVYRL